MSNYTIAEVKKFPVGTVVPAVTGTVKAVFKRTEGQGQYGPWTIQTVILADGAEELPLACWNFDDLSYLKGTTVSAAALGTNKQGKPSGAEVVAGKDKEGAPRPELKMDHKKGGFIGGDKPNPALLTPTVAPMPALTHVRSIEAPVAFPTAAAHAPAPGGKRVEGIQVGMAINCAVRMATGAGTQDIEAIEQFARQLIALSDKLQSGN